MSTQPIEDVFAWQSEGITDPYILHSRLRGRFELGDQEAREVLRNAGIEIDDLIDARLGVVSSGRPSGGFVRNCC